MYQCDKCHKYHFGNNQCPNQPYWVISDTSCEEGTKVLAESFEDAAVEYCSKWKNDEGQLVNDSIIVEVRQGDVSKKVKVSAQIIMDYDTEIL